MNGRCPHFCVCNFSGRLCCADFAQVQMNSSNNKSSRSTDQPAVQEAATSAQIVWDLQDKLPAQGCCPSCECHLEAMNAIFRGARASRIGFARERRSAAHPWASATVAQHAACKAGCSRFLQPRQNCGDVSLEQLDMLRRRCRCELHALQRAFEPRCSRGTLQQRLQ